ncbi:MAG: alpha/beta hydrolase [Pseudomonadota bacterium]
MARIDHRPFLQPHPQDLPVVMLHGSASGPRQWTGLSEFLGGRHQTLAPRMPGYGRDDAPDMTVTERADSLMAGVLSGTTALHLVGHSFGAVVALDIAARFPARVASLTLIEPVAFFETDTADRFEAMGRSARVALEEGDAYAASARFIDFWFGAGAWTRSSLAFQQNTARFAGRVMGDFAALMEMKTRRPEFATIAAPVLMQFGTASAPEMAQVGTALAARLPNAEIHRIDGAGHLPHLSDPHVSHPAIGDFLVRSAAGWHSDQRQAAA